MKKANIRLMGLLCPRIKHQIQNKVELNRCFLVIILILFVSCQALAQEVKVQQMPLAATVSTNEFKENSTPFKIDGVSPQKEQAKTFQEKITPLKIGDKIPDELWEMYFPVVSSASENEQYLSVGDFKDKLIILDFWATWCAPCISSLHKLDSLQKEFEGELLVVPTSYESKEKVQTFFANKGWSLPTAYEETTLKWYFPHRSVPHQVWIKDGEVLAITNSAAASTENISKIISGTEIKTHEKAERIDFDRKEPLLIMKDGLSEIPILYSKGFTKYIDGVGASVSKTKDNMNIFNLSVIQLYKIAFEDSIKYMDQYNRVLLEVNSKLKNIIAIPIDLKINGNYDNDKVTYNWMHENLYCYAATFPEGITNEMKYSLMKKDLNDYFGLKLGIYGQMDSRTIKCYILKKDDNHKDKTTPRVKNDVISLESFIYRIFADNRKSPVPIINEIEDMKDFTLEAARDFKDIATIKMQLAAHGITIIEEYRELPVLVISEVNNKKL